MIYVLAKLSTHIQDCIHNTESLEKIANFFSLNVLNGNCLTLVL